MSGAPNMPRSKHAGKTGYKCKCKGKADISGLIQNVDQESIQGLRIKPSIIQQGPISHPTTMQLCDDNEAAPDDPDILKEFKKETYDEMNLVKMLTPPLPLNTNAHSELIAIEKKKF